MADAAPHPLGSKLETLVWLLSLVTWSSRAISSLHERFTDYSKLFEARCANDRAVNMGSKVSVTVASSCCFEESVHEGDT